MTRSSGRKNQSLSIHAVAYANLGDLYYELNRPEDARSYYEKYLEPNNSYASTIRSRLGK